MPHTPTTRKPARRLTANPAPSPAKEQRLEVLRETIIICRKCPRLVEYRERVARTKRRAYLDWTYWGRPVPGFGDSNAQLMLIGLAPGAHGSNRTGRMFTGDASGVFLYAQLYRAGFANQPTGTRADDGLTLHNAYITAAVRCAPPDNKPLPGEMQNCAPYLDEEIDLIQPRAVLALGSIAFDTYLRHLLRRGQISTRAPYRFAHGAEFELPNGLPHLFAAYHPSQQNTQTGRLTPEMFYTVLRRINQFLKTSNRAK